MAFKGITFDKQLFKSNEFALINKKFFNNVDGRVYGIAITNTNTTIILSPGYFISSGYYTRITSNEIISVTNGTWTLVYEIDLSKVNTEDIFNQGTFKLINTVPRKDDLFNGTGTIYQLALATVIMASGTITTFASILNDITSDIFSTLTSKVDKIEGKGLSTNDYTDEAETKLSTISTGATKNEFAIIEGNFVLNNYDSTSGIPTQNSTLIDFPSGYNKDNCVLVTFGTKYYNDTRGYGYYTAKSESTGILSGAYYKSVTLGATADNSKIYIETYSFGTSLKTCYYKIVLIKIS